MVPHTFQKSEFTLHKRIPYNEPEARYRGGHSIQYEPYSWDAQSAPRVKMRSCSASTEPESKTYHKVEVRAKVVPILAPNKPDSGCELISFGTIQVIVCLKFDSADHILRASVC